MIQEVEMFKAVGEETRLRIMRIVLKAQSDLCACEIIDILEKPQYTVSKSLGVLVAAGVLSERREGRMMFYTPVLTAITEPLFMSIRQIKCACNEAFKGDFARLSKRLASRVNGVCVEGCAK